MPYKVSGSRKQHNTKNVAVKAASHGPQYRLACTGSQERTSTLNPVRSYFHVDSISAAGIERLTAESISTFRFATKIHQASSLVLALELRECLTDCQKDVQSCPCSGAARMPYWLPEGNPRSLGRVPSQRACKPSPSRCFCHCSGICGGVLPAASSRQSWTKYSSNGSE